MPDTAVFFLLHEIAEQADVFIQIRVDIPLAHVVEKIEVKILHAALAQLRFKDFFLAAQRGQVVAGKLGGEKIALARIAAEQVRHGGFGTAAVVPHAVSK